MYIRLIALTALISSSAFGMQKNKATLSHNQLVAVMRTTVITQAVVEKLHKEIASEETAAQIAEQVGLEVIAAAESGTILTDATIQGIASRSIAHHFKNLTLRKIDRMIQEESKKLKDGIIPSH